MSTSWGFPWIGHKESNSLIRSLVDKGHIKSDKVKEAFRSVQRSAFLPAGLEKQSQEDSPIKQGIYHQSSPHIYAIVIEALEFEAGHSFLNIGSGTGYLNVLAGYMIGSEGINHGIEVNKQLVEFAREKSSTFINNNSLDISKPTFIAGNFFLLDLNRKQYDRVYCGAECSESQLQDFILNEIKVDGIAVVPCNKQLLKITRSDSDSFQQEIITGVSYVPLVPLSEEDKLSPLLNFPEGTGELTKKLVEKGSIKSKKIEAVFDMVSRAIFVPPDLKGKAFEDSPIKQGMFHLSAPHMYAIVLEALNIQPGNSFLNIGSGTGYLSALAWCLQGMYGVNHGIERIQELVDFADKSIQKLKEETQQFTYSRPRFIVGSCFRLDTTNRKYDRLYCGAACTKEQLNGFIVKLLARGGVAVVPCDNKLLKVTVDQAGSIRHNVVCGVSYVPLVAPSKEEKNMPLLRFCESDPQVLTNEVERLRISLLEESNKRKELEELQQDIFEGSQDLLQEKKNLEDKLDHLTSELSSERDKREAAENTQEEVELVLSKERAEMQTSVAHLQEQFQNEREHLQEQFQNEREHLQDVVREKEEEVRRLQSELETAQNRSRGGDGDERQSWELSRDDINLSDHELGRGGWAVVKKAVFRGCPVAVKQLFDLILSPYNLRLFQREMSIASKCRHPCLLQFIGATTDEKPLIVTELLDTSLRTLLQQRSLQEKEAVEIALDVARGLNYLHLHKPPIIHRDVSSANILLWLRGSSYRAKVSDYGTANFMMACNTINPGAAVYSAPEAESRINQSTKLDIYSYGVLLCEMFIREFPLPDERERQVSLVTDEDIAAVIKDCLRENPFERPDMNGVIEVLRGIASERGLGEI